MATHKSAAKRARQAATRRDRNTAVRSGLKNIVRKFRETTASGKKDEIGATLKTAVSLVQKAASRHVLHKRTAARRVSRLMRAAAKSTQA